MADVLDQLEKKFRNNIAILFFMVIISTMGIWIIGKLY